jgi:hypothetical protein
MWIVSSPVPPLTVTVMLGFVASTQMSSPPPLPSTSIASMFVNVTMRPAPAM